MNKESVAKTPGTISSRIRGMSAWMCGSGCVMMRVFVFMTWKVMLLDLKGEEGGHVSEKVQEYLRTAEKNRFPRSPKSLLKECKRFAFLAFPSLLDSMTK